MITIKHPCIDCTEYRGNNDGVGCATEAKECSTWTESDYYKRAGCHKCIVVRHSMACSQGCRFYETEHDGAY
jgi:hypothetical protein